MLYQDKVNLDQLVGELRSYADGSQPYELIEHFNIHEVSKRTGVAKSAIRYWERSGMFNTERNPDNDYRLYNKSHLLKIKMIQVLNSSVYSEDTVSLKQSIAELDLNYIDKAVTLVENIKIHQNKTIKSQLGGLSYLYELFLSLGGLEK
nr:MerR family transcriptional regulator [Paenibacillus sp. ACRSA]